MPITTIGRGYGIVYTAASGRASDLKSIRRFFTPLPSDVLEKIPALKAWQEENWNAWEAFLEVINSPIYNTKGVAFQPGTRNSVVPAVPVLPCPLPEKMLSRFNSLRDWQAENIELWHKICHILHLRIDGAMEYGDTGDPRNITMEIVLPQLNIDTWLLPD